MKKNVFGRKFSRNTNQRKALFKSLISSLILEESIKTTLEKAKAIKGDVDKIVNKAKNKESKLAARVLAPSLGKDAINKVIADIAPRFKDRSSGYTRIMKLGRRFSDNAAMVLMEWVVKSQNSNVKTQNLDVKELPTGKIDKKSETKTKKPKQKELKKETKNSKPEKEKK